MSRSKGSFFLFNKSRELRNRRHSGCPRFEATCEHYGCGGVKAVSENHHLGLIDNWRRHISDVRQKHEPVLGVIDQALGDPWTCEADVTCEGTVNVLDVLCVIDCALNRPGHCLVDPCFGSTLPSGCREP